MNIKVIHKEMASAAEQYIYVAIPREDEQFFGYILDGLGGICGHTTENFNGNPAIRVIVPVSQLEIFQDALSDLRGDI